MRYEDWEPIYREIIEDFGYSEKKDRESAEILAEIRGSDRLDPLKEIRGKPVEVIGPFAEEIGDVYAIAAGSAVSRFEVIGEKPDLIVSDLDGDIELHLRYNLSGVPTVIHAHGDNIITIKRWANKFKGHVISTCQCKPPSKVYNFGGFTDGDRAVFLADHFDAERIILNGWDFNEPSSKDVDETIKKRKLRWAEKLIDMIEDTPVEHL